MVRIYKSTVERPIKPSPPSRGEATRAAGAKREPQQQVSPHQECWLLSGTRGGPDHSSPVGSLLPRRETWISPVQEPLPWHPACRWRGGGSSAGRGRHRPGCPPSRGSFSPALGERRPEPSSPLTAREPLADKEHGRRLLVTAPGCHGTGLAGPRSWAHGPRAWIS